MFKISTIIYLLSDIFCTSIYELSDNDDEFKNVSVRERAKLLDVNTKNSEMPRTMLKYSWTSSDIGFRQGSKLVSNDKQASLFSQKLKAKPVNSKSQYEFINFKPQIKGKIQQITTSETSFTNEKNSTGAIPKQLNENLLNYKGEFQKEPQSSHKVHTFENQKFINTKQSRYRTENPVIIDIPPRKTLKHRQNILNQRPETPELVLDMPNNSNRDRNERNGEFQEQTESKDKKDDNDCISALFCFLDCICG